MNIETYLKERYTLKTAAVYKSDIETYLNNCPQAETAVLKDITAYLGILRNRYGNRGTLHRILASLKAYYEFLNRTGVRKDNPCKAIRLRDKQNRDIQLQDLFTSQELESLLERKERFNLLVNRNKVLTGLLIYQGLLPAELEHLSLTDINLTAGTVYIKATVNTNRRTLQLKPTQIMVLHEYIEQARKELVKQQTEESLLIGSRGEPMKGEDITKHITRSFKGRFRGRTVNCQTIRQSVITNLLKAGNDLRIVQVFAGHKYPSTTEKYKQTSVEALKTAIQNYHPMR
jgi:integrase/recombinase XerD